MNSAHKVFIKEIFSSIQGEGLYVGEKQLFVRFCGCNLKCSFCDTDFSLTGAREFRVADLKEEILKFESQTVSLTGGEPLLHADFLNELLPLDRKIYLETNGVLWQDLKKIIDKIDVISMDIKLESATGEKNRFSDNEKFLNIALLSSTRRPELFIKVVFDENIEDNEIEAVCALAEPYGAEIILQPKMPICNCLDVNKIFEKFYSKYKNIRLIPQTHKFLNLR